MRKKEIPQIFTLTQRKLAHRENPLTLSAEPYFCTCGENVGKIQAKEKAKYLIIKYLAFFLVPRPGVEPEPSQPKDEHS